MNEKQGGLIGAIIGWLSQVAKWFGETIDWAYLANSGMNALVGAVIAFLATYYLRKFFKVNAKKQEEIDKMVEAKVEARLIELEQTQSR